MFAYQLPQGLQTIVNYANGVVKFEPPLYEQRYTTTMRILEDDRWSGHLQKIVEFGCAGMKLFRFLRRLESVEHLVQVDIDENILKSNLGKVVPLTCDYLKHRDRPLRVEVFKGNIIDPVQQLSDVDAVIAIEIIEHLNPDVLEKVPENIFGFTKPKLVIISTPNREFNVLFDPLRPNGLRIDDHKFEWTRQEFQDWCLEICKQYKNYKVSFFGLGQAPTGYEHLGFCTQMAIFARLDMLGEELLENPYFNSSSATQDPDKQYVKIYSEDYPFDTSKPSELEQMRSRLNSYVFANVKDENFVPECGEYHISMEPLKYYAQELSITEDELMNIIHQQGFTIANNAIILNKPESDYEDEYSY